MPLQPGTTLGPYQVTAKIDEGGMGEVYRATDTKLNRTAWSAALTCLLVLGVVDAQVFSQVQSSSDPSSGASVSGVIIDGPPPPVPPAVVSRDAEGRVTLRAIRLDGPLTLDGRLDDAIYQRVPPVSDFIQQVPDEGEPATEQTDVWVLFDDENLYVSARCWDSHPKRMVANELRRDSSNIIQNASLAVMVDTFYDRRSGFEFMTSPLGALYDLTFTNEGVNRNNDWNPVWHPRSARVADGWTTEMAIPFKSIRYKGAGPQVWSINVRRIVRWKNERSYLSAVPAAYGNRAILKPSSAATLVGLETPPRSLHLEIKPYGISGVTTDRTASVPVSNDVTGDAGFDVKYGVTQSLTADFTYNTDFAQVEDDEQRINLTRFNLFFPEKREFFLEGRDIFRFGGGGRNTPILFFSRQIGLNRGRAVPVELGARLTGKVGPYGLGLLNIQTDEEPVSGARATNFSVVRVKRDVLRRSTIGALVTQRSVSTVGDGANQVYGVDGTFAFFDNVFIDTYLARTRTPGLSGNETSYRARFEYDGDRYGVELNRLAVGDNFNPEVGFLGVVAGCSLKAHRSDTASSQQPML